GVHLRYPPGPRHEGVDQEGEEHVHDDPGGDHQRPGPDGLRVEGPLRVDGHALGAPALHPVHDLVLHPPHLHVAAQGMALRTYSVAPRRTPQTRGPRPMENRCPSIPTALAAQKCPSSCTKMSTPRTMMVAMSAVIPFSTSAWLSLPRPPGPPSGPPGPPPAR